MMRRSHDAAGVSGALGAMGQPFCDFALSRTRVERKRKISRGAASALQLSVYSANGPLESAAFMSLHCSKAHTHTHRWKHTP